MTVLMTIAGLFAFFISIFTVGFNAAFKRLWKFVFAGLFIDVILYTFAILAVTYQHFYL